MEEPVRILTEPAEWYSTIIMISDTDAVIRIFKHWLN
jgi:hypothetical protein